MFLRLVRFTFNESGRGRAQVIADDLVARIKGQPGCQSACFFSESDGASGLAVLWDTQEHANAAAAVIRPQLDAHLAGQVTGPPDAGLFPVIAS